MAGETMGGSRGIKKTPESGPRDAQKRKPKEQEIMILKMVEEGPANKHKSVKMKKGKMFTDSDGNVEFKAKGGRAGYKHGGAAKRGHGCEIK